jgi:hypothetical protein
LNIRPHRTEAEVIEEPAVEAEKYTQHLGDGKDDLTMVSSISLITS